MNPTYIILNVRRYAQRLVTSYLKSKPFLTWFWALLMPLDSLQYDFRIFANLTRYKAEASSQTGVLEIVLNKIFDFSKKRIYVQNYTLNNAVPVPYHFEVFIPPDLAFGSPALVSEIVALFALHDKIFKITVL